MIGLVAYFIALIVLYGLAIAFLPARAAWALMNAARSDWMLCLIGALAIYAAITI